MIEATYQLIRLVPSVSKSVTVGLA